MKQSVIVRRHWLTQWAHQADVLVQVHLEGGQSLVTDPASY